MKIHRMASRARVHMAPVLVTAILFLAAFGALAAPQYQGYPSQDRDRYRDHDRDRDDDRYRDHDRDRDDDWSRLIRVSHESMDVDFGGGRGGGPSPDAMCGEESVAVGFHVQTGEFFNEAWLDCVRIRRDGSRSEPRMTGRTGSPGGRPVHDAFCPRGFVLRGLSGRTGASIDEAVGVCSPLREVAERHGEPRTAMTQPIMRPNAGGHPAEAYCPRGSVVTGFRSMSGAWMDHLWLVCSELHHER